MPVSKKRKKAGKPVQRKEPAAAGAEHPHGPEGKPAPQAGTRSAAGKPSNPFVAQQPKRAAQRGR